MRLLYRDKKGRELKLLLENLDDVWHLYNLIEKEDLAIGLTYRREEVPKDKLRPERGRKRKLKLGIRIKEIEFHDFSDRLRIHGIIEQGPQDLGSYHTLNLKVGDAITIIKDWKPYQLARIKEAIEATKRPIITFLALDYDEALVALLRHYGVQPIATITSHLSGKQFKPTKGEKTKFYEQVLVKLKQTKPEDSPLIILGPGFAKEEFYKFGRERDEGLFSNYFIAGTGYAGLSGIHEVLKKGLGVRVLEESRVLIETQTVEKLLEEIAKNGLFAYGFEEVKNCLELGAVDILLLTNEMLRTKNIEPLLETAKMKKSKYTVISTSHEAGKKLASLGGVGAILRYKV